MSSLPLSPQVFAILSALVEEKVGLHYELADKDLFGDKVSTRAVEAGFESLLDYYYFLRYDDHSGTELRTLTEALVVGETYFFREYPQLKVLVDELLPPLLACGRSPRIWCAASATGEEPLTLAMLLAERGLLKRVQLVASDISQRALNRAQAGRFGRRSVRHLPEPALASTWLTSEGNEHCVRPELVEYVDWRRVNLLDEADVAALGAFDVVLCRNVLIYFRDEVATDVVRRLTARLQPGGVLFVGISESLLRFGTSLACEEYSGVFAYRKVS
jgi:chemotaxis protein methyltransferase CheR